MLDGKTKQEISVVENQIEAMSREIAALPAVISNQDEYDVTYEVGKKVHALYNHVDKKEKAITKPINDSLKSIRDLFRPFKTQVKSVEDELKARREAFIKAEDAKKAKTEDQILGRVERGTMKEETAVAKLADIEQSAPETRGGMTSVLCVKILDIRAIPEEYLTVNETAIKAAHREGQVVPGVECYYEKRARA